MRSLGSILNSKSNNIKTRALHIAFLFIFFLFRAQGQEIGLDILRSETLFAQPGKTYSVMFKVDNTSAKEVTLTTNAVLPEKWTLITGKQAIRVGPNSVQNGLLSFRVPKYQVPGNYNLALTVSVRDQARSQITREFRVEVEEQVDLSIEMLKTMQRVMAGEDYTGSAIIHNQGNAPQQVHVTCGSCEIQGESSFLIEPGKSKTIDFRAPSRVDILKSNNSTVQLALFREGHSEEISRAYQNYQIIPVREREADNYFRFPVEVGMFYILRDVRNEFRSGYQGLVSGNGFLDRARKKQLSFKAQGPNQFDLSSLGNYDEYYAAYRGENTYLHIGDKNFSMSRLSDWSRYGRGIHGEVQRRRIQMGGFYHQPRFYPDIKQVTAYYANYISEKGDKAGISVLNKKFAEDPVDANIYSVNAAVNLFHHTNLEAEVAGGVKGDKNEYGLYANLVSNWKRVNFNAFALYASKDFPGYYTNTSYYSGRLMLHLTEKLSVTANIRQDFTNAAQDTLFGAAPYIQGYNGGINIRFSSTGSIRAYYNYREQMDRLPGKRFHYTEKVMRIDFTQQLNQLRFHFSTDFGETENLLIDAIDERTSASYQLNMDMSYSIGRLMRLHGMVGYMSNNRYSQDVQNTWTYGGSISSNVKNRFNLDIRYQNRFNLEEYFRDRSIFSGQITWNVTKKHQLSLMANYGLIRKQVDATDLSVAVSYMYKIGVPIKKLSNTGSISGRVTNLSVESIEGIVLNLNGRSVITDEEGHFSFQNISPGVYYLFLDPSSVGFNDIPDVSFPLEVEVKEDEITDIYFGMTLACKVKGSIEVLENKPVTRLMEDTETHENLHVVLSLENGEKIHKLISGADGSFNFPPITPGKWQLKVHLNGLSKMFTISKKSYELDIEPGETLEIPISLKKKERKLIFKNDTFIISAR